MPDPVIPGEVKVICTEKRFHSRPELKKALKSAMNGREITISENLFDKEKSTFKNLWRVVTFTRVRHTLKCCLSKKYSKDFKDAVEKVFAAYSVVYNDKMANLGRQVPPDAPSNNEQKLANVDVQIRVARGRHAKLTEDLNKKEEELRTNNSSLEDLKKEGLLDTHGCETIQKKITGVQHLIKEIGEYKKAEIELGRWSWLGYEPDFDKNRIKSALKALGIPEDKFEYNKVDEELQRYTKVYGDELKKQTTHISLKEKADNIEKANKLIEEQKTELAVQVEEANAEIEELNKERAQILTANEPQ